MEQKSSVSTHQKCKIGTQDYDDDTLLYKAVYPVSLRSTFQTETKLMILFLFASGLAVAVASVRRAAEEE